MSNISDYGIHPYPPAQTSPKSTTPGSFLLSSQVHSPPLSSRLCTRNTMSGRSNILKSTRWTQPRYDLLVVQQHWSVYLYQFEVDVMKKKNREQADAENQDDMFAFSPNLMDIQPTILQLLRQLKPSNLLESKRRKQKKQIMNLFKKHI